MDSSRALAENIVNAKYEDLPDEVVEVTKNSILDTIGVILAASTLGEHGVKEIVELVKEGGGREESTILSFGGRVVSWMAAFANGAMAHQLDYDDTYDARDVHPGAATVPAACAIAERQGGVTGKEFITAVALGADTACRLTLPLTRNPDEYLWHPTGIFGKYGAATVAGKLLRLDETQMVDALGLVFNQVSISNECAYTPGSSVRAIRDGFMAKAGVLSALLAQRGIAGDKESLEGKYGLYNLYWLGDSDPARVTANLGTRFEGVETGFKPWPCCRNTHGFITATLGLIRENNIEPKDIEEITAIGGGIAERLSSGTERQKPKSSIDAKFSLPFVLGVAVAKGNVLLEDFTPKGMSNPAALEIAEKVVFRRDEQFQRPGVEAAGVEIKTGGGKKYYRRVDFAYGHPRNPLAREDLLAKFRDCASYAIIPLSPERIDEIILILGSLEEVKDISQVIQLLV